jgi:hypothetical protein
MKANGGAGEAVEQQAVKGKVNNKAELVEERSKASKFSVGYPSDQYLEEDAGYDSPSEDDIVSTIINDNQIVKIKAYEEYQLELHKEISESLLY